MKKDICTIIDKVALLAKELHAGQNRKFGDRPYFYHIEKVVEKLRYHTNDSIIISAAYLHDTVEDCGISIEDLYRKLALVILGDTEAVSETFDEITRIVGNLTKDPIINKVRGDKFSPNRRSRWLNELRRLTNSCEATKMIKLCDRISNLREYVDFVDELPYNEKNFIRHVYLVESNELLDGLWVYGNGRIRELCRELFDVIHETDYIIALGSDL